MDMVHGGTYIGKNVQNIDSDKCRLLDLEINGLYNLYSLENNLIIIGLIKMTKNKYASGILNF
jgi:hypothetical protein